MFSRFLRSPRTVGALSASSRALARAVVDVVDFEHATGLVELGPGTGALTSAIVGRLHEGTRFLAVDIDPEFVKQVHRQWPAVECVCASAERLEELVVDRGMFPVDHIISGLPFASLHPAMTAGILESVERSLRPGGRFTTFQYVYSYALPTGVAFRRQMSARMRSEPTSRLVLRNVPPARLLTWTKPE